MQTAQGPDRGAGTRSDAGPDEPIDPPTDPLGRDVPAVGPAPEDRTTSGARSATRTSSVGMSMVGLTDDADKRARLRRMKAVALSFLLGAAVIWVIFRLWEGNGGPAFTGYVRAAAEAGMIGGLADWFAITALFRHPLGIKVPHTALIPRKKDQLGQSLSGFVGDNFLAPAVVADKLRTAQVTARVGSWLASPGNAARVTAELATVVRGAVTVLRDDEIQAVVDQAVTRRVVAQPWGPPLGRLLAGVLADGSHRRLVDLICDRAYDWVRNNHETVMALVSRQAPSWSPRFVDGLIADRIYAEALSFAWAVKADPDHPLRKAIDRFLVSFAGDLQDDPETGERVEAIKRQLLEHPDVQALISRAWATGKAMLLDAAEDPSSQLRLRVTDGVTRFGERLDTDAELRDKIDGWIVDAAGYVVGRYSREITTLISDTVERWDGHEASRKIELQVGRDLQFIRINGTLVGALVGLAIYSVGELLV
ncbi:uncharacterized membrane-anchored protein YjiN (DUF445 family) [Actinomycetospora cinnamomea]|uniref:Uncharacterized membrane-anchored protein YjiN (DUF445 family) n=2 Tax=Actinomycetospora cinnamomea TaxID=663609 RepID=A0A2U1FDK9_9PSEU|nr:uncharacterized membrane-anchored protein YjiN (DUF445 family) [Actinomycetospora cinnamomea]